MEMHHIRYFLAVADELNFTKAAEKCNVSQPSLTRAIKLLEEELGGLLFHRERAHTRLSDLGQMMRPYLQQIYDETHQAKRLAHDFTCLKKSILKLGIMCTIAPNAIIQLIRSIQLHHPGVELQLCDGKASDLQDRLLGGGLEVAVYCVPGQEPDDRLHAMPLFREQIVIAMPDTHPASLGEAETCLAFILGISVPLSALLIVMLRQGCPLRPNLTLVIGGLACASAAATLLNFIHPYDATATDLTVHAFAVATVILANAIFGGRLLMGKDVLASV